MKRSINAFLVVAVLLSTLTSTVSAAQPCCCPDHGQDTQCAMSCGPFESPDALAAVPNVAKLIVTAGAIPPSFVALSVQQPADTLERFTPPSNESPPKRYLRYRVLRL